MKIKIVYSSFCHLLHIWNYEYENWFCDSRYKVYSVINLYIIDERYFYQNENNLLANKLHSLYVIVDIESDWMLLPTLLKISD
jgi:hypothetical protein